MKLVPTLDELKAAVGGQDAVTIETVSRNLVHQYEVPTLDELRLANEEGKEALDALIEARKARGQFLVGLLKLGVQVVGALEPGPVADMLNKGVRKIQERLSQPEE